MALAKVVVTASPNPHPADTTRTPSRKTTPKVIPGTTFSSRYTRNVSATMKPAATAMPTASGGAVGRTNRPTRRPLMGGEPAAASEVGTSRTLTIMLGSNRCSDHLPDAVGHEHRER